MNRGPVPGKSQAAGARRSPLAWWSVALSMAASGYAYAALMAWSATFGGENAQQAPHALSVAVEPGVAVWVVAAVALAGFACSYRSLVRAEPRTGIAVLGALLCAVLPIAAMVLSTWSHSVASS